MQYFQGTGPIQGRNVTRILTAVIAGLLEDPKRRFSYVEQAYFQVFFENQSPEMQATIRGLVASRQLVFLNGGFSMHDEASPSFVDMLDNTAVGQRAILDNFGESALPTVTWRAYQSGGQVGKESEPPPDSARPPTKTFFDRD
jgi:alpha-mannosidase